VAPTGVPDKSPIKAEGMSRNPSPWGIRMVDDHWLFSGEIGEIYLLLTFGFQGFFISTYTHRFVTSLNVTPTFPIFLYYTHLSLRELKSAHQLLKLG
jgi:hypothetical protein